MPSSAYEKSYCSAFLRHASGTVRRFRCVAQISFNFSIGYSGSKELDDILGGGIASGDLTEIYGEYRTGKSQLMYTLAVQAQLSAEHGGANGKAVFIDTEGSFKPERFKPIAERFGVSADAAMDYIMCAKPATCTCSSIWCKLIYLLCATHKNVKILLIDSIMAPFRTEFEAGRGQLADRQANIGKLISHLKRLAKITILQ